jgi:hypothetical protein
MYSTLAGESRQGHPQLDTRSQSLRIDVVGQRDPGGAVGLQ